MMEESATTGNGAHHAPSELLKDPVAELEAFKEKTKQWKQAVKAQLEDAAAKNLALREEIKRLNATHDEHQRSLRLELDSEFRERTQHKDDTIEQLTKDIAAMRESHNKELAEVRRLHEQQFANEQAQQQAAHESALAAATRRHQAELENSQEEVERTIRTLENVRHDLAISQAKLTQVKSQNDDLVAQASVRASDEEYRNISVEERQASAKEVDALRAQLELHVAKQQALSEQLERVAMEHKSDMNAKDELREDEIQRREERIIVLQTILKQSQKESNDVQLRWATLQEEHHRELSAQISDRERLLSQSRALQSQLEELKKRAQHVEEEYLRAKRTVAELEEANVIRDRTFQELLMSDDQKTMMSLLEQRLDKATLESARWQEECLGLRQTIEAQKQAVKMQADDVAHREEELTKKLTALSEKQIRIVAQEKRLREQHQQLSSQAEQILGATRNGASSTSSLLENGGGVDGGAGLSASPPGAIGGDIANNMIQSLRNSIINIQHNYRTAVARSNGSKKAAASLLFRHYRNMLPVIFIALFIVTLVYWWMFSGVAPSTSGDKSLTVFSDMKEELTAMKKEYNLLLASMKENCPSLAKPIPPPVLQAAGQKLV
jgi:hypothetical protein